MRKKGKIPKSWVKLWVKECLLFSCQTRTFAVNSKSKWQTCGVMLGFHVMRDSAPKPFTRIHPLNTLPHFPSCSSCLLGLPSHLINKNEQRTAPHIPPELPSAGTQISLYYLLILQPFKENISTSSCKKNHCFVKMGSGLDLFYMKRKE